MLKIAISFFMMILLLGQLGTARVSLKNVDGMEDFALQDRLQRILAHQYIRWQKCPLLTNEENQKLWSWYELNQQNGSFNNLSKSEQKKNILRLIEAIQETKNSPATCFAAQNTKVVSSIRSKIVMPPTLKRDIYKFYKELAPACFPVAGKGGLNNPDGNACFAADEMIVQDANSFSQNLAMDALIFADLLLEKIQTVSKGQTLDLYATYASVFQGSPKQMLTLFASFVTSGNSGVTGWLQGVEDTLLVADLNQKLTKEQIYDRYKMLQEAKLKYQVFREFADKLTPVLTVFGVPVDKWNRHNFMATYLGCREQGTQEDVVKRVSRIGIGYESKDFVSHIREGVSWDVSVDNFKVDTQRYREGAALGYRVCH